jgi:hypothetical protein
MLRYCQIVLFVNYGKERTKYLKEILEKYISLPASQNSPSSSWQNIAVDAIYSTNNKSQNTDFVDYE